VSVKRGYGGRALSAVQRQNPRSGVRGIKQSAPVAKALLVFGRSMEAANLVSFLKFVKTEQSDICVIFAKIMGDHKILWGEGWSGADLGSLCPAA